MEGRLENFLHPHGEVERIEKQIRGTELKVSKAEKASKRMEQLQTNLEDERRLLHEVRTPFDMQVENLFEEPVITVSTVNEARAIAYLRKGKGWQGRVMVDPDTKKWERKAIGRMLVPLGYRNKGDQWTT